MSHKAIFLDRDDTLIDDPGYIKSPEQIKLLPGATEALSQLKKMGYLLVIVTNQSAIARGYIDERQLDTIHSHLKSLLAEDGVGLDGLYYCPFHPEGVVKDFSMESNLRKPNSGMLEKAAGELDIDLSRSWMIGDSYRDVKAGKNAGCQTILVDVPGKTRQKKADDPDPDRKAVNLREAVNIVRMFEFHQKAKAVKKDKAETAAPETAPTPAPRIEKRPAPTVEVQKTPAATAARPTPEKKIDEPNKPKPAAPEKPKPTAPPVKLHTTKSVVAKEEQAVKTGDPDKTHHLMEEILQRLKSHGRTDLYDDFSVFKLLATMAQVIALTCIVVSLVFWLSPNHSDTKVQIMIGYGIVLQLLVIALLMMHKRD